MIPAPTGTSGAPPTPTIDPFAPTPAPTGIAIGNYVQITGTEGQGLRIRAEPGLDGELAISGYDSEVFIVQDGPREVDGYIWWYLVAPYDETRVGWAAADFLTLCSSTINRHLTSLTPLLRQERGRKIGDERKTNWHYCQ